MTDYRPTDEARLAIDAPHVYYGVILNNDRVSRAAPIVRYLRGWTTDRLNRYCAERGWRVEAVPHNGGKPDVSRPDV